MQQPVAIITGAGRGIGRATAVLLSQTNYRLALLARTAPELEETRRLCGGGMVLPVDVADADAVQRAIAQGVEQFGRIDAIIHCAGLAPLRAIAETSVTEWHAILNTNLSAAFYLWKAAWPVFARQGSGVVVNVSSVAARDPLPGLGAYAAAKVGLNMLGFCAAREGKQIGVRVHTVAPGAVETAMLRQVVSAEHLPTEKTLAPADVARVICQCVTGELAHTSGEVIYLHKEA
jgi:3-oxoacyl-[acyl-carrier protein] reductase